MAKVLIDEIFRQQTGGDVFDLSSICVDGKSDDALRWGRGRQGFRAVRVTHLGLDHVDSVGRYPFLFDQVCEDAHSQHRSIHSR